METTPNLCKHIPKSIQLLSIVIISMLFCCHNAYAASKPAPIINPNHSVSAQNPYTTLAPIIKQAMPSIVAISGIKHLVRSNDKQMLSRSEYQSPEDSVALSFGSGIIVDNEKGHILTNAHVINNLDEIWVTLSDKRKFDAKVLGVDLASDMALLEIPTINTKAIQFADSDKLEVGDFAIAIGNPFGLEQTVTTGIISALSRTGLGRDGFYDLIQTDAAINMGNSGGGLLNYRGELIGINTAIVSPPTNGGSVGLGFAIPSNMAKSIYIQLATTGHVDRGVFGVQVQYVNSNLAEAFGLTSAKGAIITDILPNSPAERAKLQIGDVIIQIGEKEVIDPVHLRTLISLVQPGNSTNIKVIRDKKEFSVSVNIANPRDNYTKAESLFTGLNGAWLEQATPQTSEYPGLLVMDVDPKTPAARLDLRKGDIIVAANKLKTPTIKDFKKAASSSSTLLMQVIRNKNTLFVAAKE